MKQVTKLVSASLLMLFVAVTTEAGTILIPSGAKNSVQEEANRALVKDFWDNFFSGHTDEWQKWLSPEFVNHDPYEPSGGKAFADFVKGNEAPRPPQNAAAKEPAPPARSNDRLFLMADGDLVLIVYPGSNKDDVTEDVHGNIVRVKGGKITDWWLVGSFPGRAGKPKPYANKAGVQPIGSNK